MKKFLLAVLCLSLVVFSFAACSGNNNAANDAENTAGEGSFTMETLNIGTNAEFPPFEYVDSEAGVIDEFAGIDMEVAKSIAESVSAKPVINNMDFDGLLLALGNGQVDAVIAGMSITPERQEQVDFSKPYYKATQVMIVPEDSAIAAATDLAGKKIGVIDGYTGQSCVEELGYDYSGYKKGADAVLDLANGKLDAVVIDSSTAEKFIGETKGLKIVEDSNAFDSEEYAIAVKKGNTELLNAINAQIDKLTEDGSIDKFCEKYEGADAE